MKRILWIDSDTEIIPLDVRFLKENGYDVQHSSYLENAQQKLKEVKWDLIIIEPMLIACSGSINGNEPGFDLLNRMLNEPHEHKILVASTQGMTWERCPFFKKIDKILPKPFMMRELLAATKEMLPDSDE